MTDLNPQLTVSAAYDHLAPWYLTWVTTHRSPRTHYTTRLLAHIRSLTLTPSTHTPTILDLGCGPALPTTSHLLASGAHVLANDISPVQIALARKNCPTAKFIPGDMATLKIPASTLDGVVAFYSIFHLPREAQRMVLRRVYEWLRPGGVLVVNFAAVDEEEIWGEVRGQGMFWSGFGVEGSLEMVRGAGFEGVEGEVVGAEAEEGEEDYGSEFLWIWGVKGVEGGVGGGISRESSSE